MQKIFLNSATPLSEEQKTTADAIKNEANDRFRDGHFDKSIELYTKAININPHMATYYGNRSFAYLKTEFFGSALTDASLAIELDKNYIKGYYRRAAANMSLGKFKLALKDFEIVSKVRPKDKGAKMKYDECNKIVKMRAFEKAISVEDRKKSAIDTLEMELISIEDDYSGPVIDELGITVEFMRKLVDHLKNQKKLHRKYAYMILTEIHKYFVTLPTLVDIKVAEGSKFTVCGDIHGQYYDLCNIFDLNGFPSEDNPYLFNGDFVDRGSFSVEVILVLLGFKLLYPNHMFLARGNHETETMNQMYGFEGEVRAKYSSHMAQLFTEIYNLLPLSHLINNKVLVMHGGLFSNPDVTIADIRAVERVRQPPETGIMCELLWSDPMATSGVTASKRGVGVQFGPDVTANFIEKNKLDYIIRSHEVKQEGYEVTHDGQCVTIFSAPNYCDCMGNQGAFITLTAPELTPKFTSYSAVEHPLVRPMAYANPLLGLLS